jgi:hypothetical protein
MDAASYRRECLFRHPKFRDDLVGFYRRFPFLLRLWPRESDHPSFESVPEAIRHLIEQRTSRVIVLTPRTLEDVFLLLDYLSVINPLCPQCLWAYQRLNPRWQPEYFIEIGTGETQETYRDTRKHVLQRWPMVPSDLIFFGQQERAVYPSFIPKPIIYSHGMLREWQEEFIRLSETPGLLGFIPYYTHTTGADVDDARRQLQEHEVQWQRLRGRQRHILQRRQRPDQYQRRLYVWDAYLNCQMFAPIADTLGLSNSTIQGIYLQASRDILGSDAQSGVSRRTRLLQGFDPHTHTQGCGQCHAGPSIEKMCARARAWALQDER